MKKRKLHIADLLKKKRDCEALVQECGSLLLPGNYHAVNKYGKMALQHGPLRLDSPRNLYYQAVFGTIRVPETPGSLKCNLALPSPFRNYKLFDESSRRVITRYSEGFWDNAKRFYEYMAPKLPTLILSADYDQHLLIERQVTSVGSYDQLECFRSLYSAFYSYLSNVEPSNRALSVKEISEKLGSAALPKVVRDYIAQLEALISDDTESYPTVICHNDMNVDNVLTENGSVFYIIDYELCSENVFFFDVLGLIVNSYLFKRDSTLFDAYLRGAFDSELTQLFSLFGKQFDTGRRWHYALLLVYFKIYLVSHVAPEYLPEYTVKIQRLCSTAVESLQNN